MGAASKVVNKLLQQSFNIKCLSKMKQILNEIDIVNENPYDQLNREMSKYLRKDTINQTLPLMLMQLINFDGI